MVGSRDGEPERVATYKHVTDGRGEEGSLVSSGQEQKQRKEPAATGTQTGFI